MHLNADKIKIRAGTDQVQQEEIIKEAFNILK